MHIKCCLQRMEGSLIWSGRNKCHPAGIHPSAISISPHTSPFQDVPIFCSCEMELAVWQNLARCSKEPAQTRGINQEQSPGTVEGMMLWSHWVRFLHHSVFPMHLCNALSRQHLRADKLWAETRAGLSTPIIAEIVLLHLRNLTSAQAGNGNQVKQASSAALHAAAAFLGFSLAAVLLSRSKETLGLCFVCARSSPSAFPGQPFPGLCLLKHFPGICLLSVHWDRALLCPTGVCCCPWALDLPLTVGYGCEEKWGYTADGRPGSGILVQFNSSHEKFVLYTKSS